jgi:hypothetical protein
VKGFINRNQEVSDANAKFLQFVRYRFLLKLKDALPKAILGHDRAWPDAPPAAKEVRTSYLQIFLKAIVFNCRAAPFYESLCTLC